MQGKRKYVRKIHTRDPMPVNRDPQMDIKEARRLARIVESDALPPIAPNTRNPRRYISASMPTVCPECGHNTRMDDGRHVDPVRRKILEYRTCVKCGAALAAGRQMTEREAEKLCSRAQAIKEYEELEGLK